MSATLAEHLASAAATSSPASIGRDQEAMQLLTALSTAAALGTSISAESFRRRAHWETTKRVLAQAVNEGLAIGTIELATGPRLWLRAPQPEAISGCNDAWIQCGVCSDAYVEMDGLRVIGFLRAEDLLNPVLTGSANGEPSQELDPAVLCRTICSWQPGLAGDSSAERLIKEVQNATDNQAKWLEISATQPRLHLRSPLADWEQSVVTGHPTHPVCFLALLDTQNSGNNLIQLHKTCFAQPPLRPIVPDDIPELLSPELTFLSVPKSDLRVTGPFEKLIEPLLKSLEIPQEPEDSNRMVVPCFTRQLPAILPLFPEARQLKSVPDLCRAQISMRSISFQPQVNFPYHLKMSLFVQITSGMRVIRPWGASLGPALGKLLPDLLPPDVWILQEPATVTGAQSDELEARHISCVIRKLPDQFIGNSEEILIPGAGLYQRPFDEDQTYMEILFGLDSLKKKRDWFRNYAAILFSALMPPLVRFGLGFESHLQNVLVRVNVATKQVTGIAIRDLEGTRIYYPSFLRSGCNLREILGDSPRLADSPLNPWNKVHHSVIQDNVGPILHILGLESHGGWSIVREELEKVLNPTEDPDGKALWEHFTQKEMAIPRFMGMRLLGGWFESHERNVPNFLLRN